MSASARLTLFSTGSVPGHSSKPSGDPPADSEPVIDPPAEPEPEGDDPPAAPGAA